MIIKFNRSSVTRFVFRADITRTKLLEPNLASAFGSKPIAIQGLGLGLALSLDLGLGLSEFMISEIFRYAGLSDMTIAYRSGKIRVKLW